MPVIIEEGFSRVIPSFCLGGQKSPLIAFAPLLNEEDLTADSHVQFIDATLAIFGKSRNNIGNIGCDNENHNKAISRILKVPMIGCASHRFNLAVNHILAGYEEILQKIHSLMKRLRTLKNAAALRKKTDLRPVMRNQTRWSSAFKMISRFLELYPFLDVTNPEIAEFLPTAIEKIEIECVYEDLKKLDSITLKLQNDKLSLFETRVLFDPVIGKFPQIASHISTQTLQ